MCNQLREYDERDIVYIIELMIHNFLIESLEIRVKKLFDRI